jgi:hypothetical protein
MEITIRAAVILIVILIGFVVIVALMVNWAGSGQNLFEGILKFFEKVSSGEIGPGEGQGWGQPIQTPGEHGQIKEETGEPKG